MKHDTSVLIKKLPLSFREKLNENQRQISFHVYLSRFFPDFKDLDQYEKQEYLVSALMDEGGLSLASISKITICPII